MQIEYWRPVPDFENLYEVSNLGRVRSLHKRNEGNILSTYVKDGVLTVQLSKDGKAHHCKLHRILACAYLPNPDEKSLVIFRDGNILNCKLENLKWADSSESVRYSKSTEAWKAVFEKLEEEDFDFKSPRLLRELTEDFQLSRI